MNTAQPLVFGGRYVEDTDSGSNITEIRRADDGRLFSMKRKRVSLVLFSGGVESTYVLAKLLRETEDEVIAHHVHLINLEGRHLVEAERCEQIVAYMNEHFRPFQYTESTVDRRKFQVFGLDVITAAFEAAIVSESFRLDRFYGIDRWTTGACLEDFEEGGVEQEEGRLTSMFAAFEANSAKPPQGAEAPDGSTGPTKVPRYFQLPYVSKRDEIDYLGPEIARLSWSCRTPKKSATGSWRACGTCKSCRLRASVEA